MANSKLAPVADFQAVRHQSPESAQKVWESVNKGWQPGKDGKGMLVNGELYHWNTVDDDGWPHHHNVVDVMHTLGMPVLTNDKSKALAPDVHLIYYIDPDGTFDSSDGRPGNPIDAQVSQIDPRLNLDGHGWKFADEGGGGDVGGESAESPHPDSHHDHEYPYMGVWGLAMGTHQSKRRQEKKHKKHKKKADIWDDQRKQDFPEDFEPEMGEGEEQPHNHEAENIKRVVAKGYTPGAYGKAIVDQSGNRVDWNCDKFGGPHHHEVEVALGILPAGAGGQILIDPSGKETSWNQLLEDEEFNDDAKDQGYGSGWVFGSWDEEESGGKLNWEEGNEGKGILSREGHLHTWNADDYEVHSDYLDEHPDLDHADAHYLYISPHGKVSTAWGTLTPDHHDIIKEADPRLYVDMDTGSGTPWAFG